MVASVVTVAFEGVDARRVDVQVQQLSAELAATQARADRLLPQAKDGPARRTLLGWRGLSLDALGRHAEAAGVWREMVRLPVPGQVLPPPAVPSDEAPAGKIDGLLLWSPPGVRAEFVLRQAKAQLGPKLRLDRIGSEADGDGFGVRRRAGACQASVVIQPGLMQFTRTAGPSLIASAWVKATSPPLAAA